MTANIVTLKDKLQKYIGLNFNDIKKPFLAEGYNEGKAYFNTTGEKVIILFNEYIKIFFYVESSKNKAPLIEKILYSDYSKKLDFLIHK